MALIRPFVDDHYAHVMHRLNNVNALGALAINATIALSVHDNPRSLACVGGCVLALVPINMWITLVLLKKRGALFAESLRVAINVSSSLVVNHAIGWPLPVWLFLPFYALAFDGFKRRTTWAALAFMCVGYSGLALYDGVAWIYPVTFTVLSCFCRIVTETRLHIVRDMFVRSEQQRSELDSVHSALKSAHDRLTAAVDARTCAELELRQAQKLEAVGQLAAGIAHEINTPTQYIGDSIHFLREAHEGHQQIIKKYKHAVDALRIVSGHEVLVSEIRDLENEIDLEYLEANVPGSFDRCVDGISRISTIVRAMKEFAHPDEREMSPAALNQALENTLAIAHHEYKYVADLETAFGDLPSVCCHIGDLNQAFLNLIVNAAHAIGDVVGQAGGKGRIRVGTLREGDSVRIDISDTGSGIPESVRDRIFEPFFTTKEVGRGSGQGLVIARSIVVDKHGGTLTFDSEAGKGTTFTIRLPIDGKVEVHHEAS